KRNHETHIQSAFCMLPLTCEAMQDSAHARVSPMLLDQLETVFPSIVAIIRWPTVNHDRQLRGPGKFHLANENVLLHVPRRMIVVIVEPNFSPGNNLRFPR